MALYVLFIFHESYVLGEKPIEYIFTGLTFVFEMTCDHR